MDIDYLHNRDIWSVIFDFSHLNDKLQFTLVCKALYHLTLSFFTHHTLNRSQYIAHLQLSPYLSTNKSDVYIPKNKNIVKLIMNYALGIAKDHNIVIVGSLKSLKAWKTKLLALKLLNLRNVELSQVLYNSTIPSHDNYINLHNMSSAFKFVFKTHRIIVSTKTMFCIEDKYIHTLIIDNHTDKIISRELSRHKVHQVITFHAA